MAASVYIFVKCIDHWFFGTQPSPCEESKAPKSHKENLL